MIADYTAEFLVFYARRILSHFRIIDTDGHSRDHCREISSLPTASVGAKTDVSSFESQSDRNTIHVPIEIVDQILGYIRTDKECLRRCALVCKSWLPSCRRHIFYDLNFTGPPSRFEAWHRSFSPTPNGPHLNTKQLIVAARSLDREYCQPYNKPTPFFQHWFLFTNVRDLYISGVGGGERSLDRISIPDVFGHLSGTLRSLRIHLVRCYPQTLISLITSFPHLEHTDLSSVFFQTSTLPPPQLERHTFKGVFHFTDWGNSSEEFATLLAEHDLRYHEMHVRGERWLRETGWNRCLEKCAHHLEEFSIMWTESDGMWIL